MNEYIICRPGNTYVCNGGNRVHPSIKALPVFTIFTSAHLKKHTLAQLEAFNIFQVKLWHFIECKPCLVNHRNWNSYFLPFKAKTYLRLSFLFSHCLIKAKLAEHETMWLGQRIWKKKKKTQQNLENGNIFLWLCNAKSNQAAICLDSCVRIQKEGLNSWEACLIRDQPWKGKQPEYSPLAYFFPQCEQTNRRSCVFWILGCLLPGNPRGISQASPNFLPLLVGSVVWFSSSALQTYLILIPFQGLSSVSNSTQFTPASVWGKLFPLAHIHPLLLLFPQL